MTECDFKDAVGYHAPATRHVWFEKSVLPGVVSLCNSCYVRSLPLFRSFRELTYDELQAKIVEEVLES